MGLKKVFKCLSTVKPEGLIAEPIVHLLWPLLAPKDLKSIRFKLTNGFVTEKNGIYRITFEKGIDLSLLENGFYLDKRISKNHFNIQRQIIQDFIDKNSFT